jgi:DedD protein
MAESQEIGALKRRGRRRLVGAIALVLLAVIVLPMVFDSEPRQDGAPAVSVRIPSEDDAGFSPKPAPKIPNAPKPPAPPEAQRPAAAPKAEAKPEEKQQQAAVAPKAEPKPEEKPTAQAPQKAPPQGAEQQRAQAAVRGEQFIIPVAALANADKLKELVARLNEAKLPYYTEPVATAQGQVTRVRVGPFDDRAAAEKAAERLKTLGLKPGNVAARS